MQWQIDTNKTTQIIKERKNWKSDNLHTTKERVIAIILSIRTGQRRKARYHLTHYKTVGSGESRGIIETPRKKESAQKGAKTKRTKKENTNQRRSVPKYRIAGANDDDHRKVRTNKSSRSKIFPSLRQGARAEESSDHFLLEAERPERARVDFSQCRGLGRRRTQWQTRKQNKTKQGTENQNCCIRMKTKPEQGNQTSTGTKPEPFHKKETRTKSEKLRNSASMGGGDC